MIMLSILTLYSCELDTIDIFSVELRDAISGEWRVDEDSEIFGKKSTERFYNVIITKDATDTTAVWVDGFYELSGKVKMILNDTNIEIPDQIIDGFKIELGSGSISDDIRSITLYYYIDLGTGEKDIVRADYTR